MKAFILVVVSLLICHLSLSAQPRIYDDRGKAEVHNSFKEMDYITPGCVSFFEGGYEKNGTVIAFQDKATQSYIVKAGFLEEGEIMIYQDLMGLGMKSDWTAFVDASSPDDLKAIRQGLDSIDNNTIVHRAVKRGEYGITKFIIEAPHKGPVEEWKSERQMSFSIQWIGLLSDFKLNSIKSPSMSLDEWIKEKNMSENTTKAEIMWTLTNELECKAVDTYGQEIVLNCPYYSWEIDKEAGTATYTPYFTPRLYKTRWKSGEPFEMTFSANKSAGVGSDGDNYEYKDNKLVLRLWAANNGGVTGKSDMLDNHSLSVRADGRNILVSTTSVYYVYDSSGRPVFHGSDSRVTVSAPGLYILRTADGLTEKVTVK